MNGRRAAGGDCCGEQFKAGLYNGTCSIQFLCMLGCGAMDGKDKDEEVGTYVQCKFDYKLFRRSTRTAEERRLTECQFADDAALLSTTRVGPEQAIKSFIEVAGAFGLTVSLSKTKLMVAGHDVQEEEKTPIHLEDSEIEYVDSFTYLGSVVSSNGRIVAEVDKRIANASKAFGALHHAVFNDRNLTTNTKWQVYKACVLSILLNGSECWTPLRRHLNRLNAFHHHCIRIILDITSMQQCEQRITS